MNDILEWMASPAELEKIEFERILREAELEEKRRRTKAHAEKLITKYHHKRGYDYKAGKRCYCRYCPDCRKDKDYLDEYYNEKGDWEQW